MNKLLKYTLLLFLVAFAACSSEDDAVPTVPNGQPQPGDVLELTVSAVDFVTDGTPDTRATDNGNETTFDDGDRVGIIILDENSHLIYDNIPYEYNSGDWTFDSNNDEGKGECYYDSKATTYIVYYPYCRAADGVTSVDDLKAKFAPKFDQSDIKDYRASDLMVWSNSKHLTFSAKVLNVELKHAFVSVYLALIEKYKLEDEKETDCSFISLNISDVSLTLDNIVYVPFQATDGSLRCIVPADIINPNIRYFYTFGSKTYGNTISIQSAVKSNTRYTSKPVIIDKTYTLDDAKVGDFYCRRSDNNGYLIPIGAILTPEQQAACIGIVYCVDNNFITRYSTNQTIGGFTHGLVIALKDASTYIRWNGAADAALNYGSAVSVPVNCSGWYFPNCDELKYVCRGINFEVESTNGKKMLNIQFNNLGKNATPFGNNFYWSSSERTGWGAAYGVHFSNGYVDSSVNQGYYSVRSSLAF